MVHAITFLSTGVKFRRIYTSATQLFQCNSESTNTCKQINKCKCVVVPEMLIYGCFKNCSKKIFRCFLVYPNIRSQFCMCGSVIFCHQSYSFCFQLLTGKNIFILQIMRNNRHICILIIPFCFSSLTF